MDEKTQWALEMTKAVMSVGFKGYESPDSRILLAHQIYLEFRSEQEMPLAPEPFDQ